jgi:hypothetical protein
MKRSPFFLFERTWDDNTKLPEKYKFQGTNTRNKASEVHIDSGTLGMEFFLERTLSEFNQAGTRLAWSWSKSFLEFENVIGDGYRTCTTWLDVLTDYFPKLLENKPEATRELKRCDKKENFYRAISIFICEILGDQKPCDWQYIYMQPGGDYPFQKDHDPSSHACTAIRHLLFVPFCTLYYPRCTLDSVLLLYSVFLV